VVLGKALATLAVLVLAWGFAAWIFVKPGLASDFGIIPIPAQGAVGQSPGAPQRVARPHRRIFPGVKFWRSGVPSVADLQAVAAGLRRDVDSAATQIWTDHGPDVGRLQAVSAQVQEDIQTETQTISVWIVPPLTWAWRYIAPPIIHHHGCREQDQKNCPIKPSIPEPGVWALLLLGFGVLGARLRWRRRSAESNPIA